MEGAVGEDGRCKWSGRKGGTEVPRAHLLEGAIAANIDLDRLATRLAIHLALLLSLGQEQCAD